MSSPHYHGCLDAVSMALPYCNTSLTHALRADDIISRINITEKIGLLSPHDAPNYCGCEAAPVPRIGLPGWRWLTEINTVIGGALSGLDPTRPVGCGTALLLRCASLLLITRSSHDRDPRSQEPRASRRIGAPPPSWDLSASPLLSTDRCGGQRATSCRPSCEH